MRARRVEMSQASRRSLLAGAEKISRKRAILRLFTLKRARPRERMRPSRGRACPPYPSNGHGHRTSFAVMLHPAEEVPEALLVVGYGEFLQDLPLG